MLPPLCKSDLRSSGSLRSVDWWFRTDALGQPICPIFKGFACPLEMGKMFFPETSV